MLSCTFSMRGKKVIARPLVHMWCENKSFVSSACNCYTLILPLAIFNLHIPCFFTSFTSTIILLYWQVCVHCLQTNVIFVSEYDKDDLMSYLLFSNLYLWCHFQQNVNTVIKKNVLLNSQAYLGFVWLTEIPSILFLRESMTSEPWTYRWGPSSCLQKLILIAYQFLVLIYYSLHRTKFSFSVFFICRQL